MSVSISNKPSTRSLRSLISDRVGQRFADIGRIIVTADDAAPALSGVAI